MSASDHFEHTEQPAPPREIVETQRDIELTGAWDDDKRREAIEQNELEPGNQQLSYMDSLNYLKDYEADFINAGLELAQDSEERGKWKATQEQMELDFDLARLHAAPAVMRLVNEVESHLKSLAQMNEKSGEDENIHENDIQDLRRVRDSLFKKYEEIPPSEMRQSFEDAYGKLTGHAPPPHLRNSIENRKESDAALEHEKPGLGEVLDWIDQTLGWNNTSAHFKEMFGEVRDVPPETASRMAVELADLYQKYRYDELSIEEYNQEITSVFEKYQEKPGTQQAA